MKKLLLFTLSILSLHTAVLAQFPIAGTVWSGSGISTTVATDPSTFTTRPATVIPGAASVNVSQWNRANLTGTATSATFCYNSSDWEVGGSFASAVANNRYMYFTITNDAATEVEVTAIHLETQVSNTGPTNVQWQYAIGAGANQNFGTATATAPTASPSTLDFSGVAHICPGQTATFKLYGWGATGAAGTLRINDNSSITATYAFGPPSVIAFNTTDIFTPACVGTEVDLSSFPSSGVAPYTYSWSGPGGYTSTDANPIINPIALTGDGDYSVTVTDAYQCSSTAAITTVYVNPSPDTTMTLSGPLSFCTPGSETLTVPFDPGYDYTWYDVSSGTPVMVDFGPNFYTSTISGSFYVEILDWAFSGCTAISDTYTVNATVTPPATISASGPLTMCTPNTVTLSTPTGTGFTYQWYNGAGAIAGATSSSYNVTASGTYSVTVINGSCSATSTGTTVTINTAPVTPSVTPVGPVSICSGTTLTLTSTTQTGVTYRWWRGGFPIPGATNATYVPAASGTYSMVVTNTANTCNATSNGVVVTINSLPVSTITANPGTTVCSGNSVTLSTTSSASNTYQWLLNGTPVAGATNATYTTTTTGTYRVVVTNTTTGCFDTTTAPGTTLTAAAAPTAAEATISPAGPFTICSNDSVVLSVPSVTGYTYQWYRPAVIAGATNRTYTAKVTGTYSVRVTNAAGCSTTSGSTVSITVNPAPGSTVTLSGPVTFCAGGSVTITAATGAGYTYQWYDASGAIAGANSSAYNATASGTYYVVVTAPNTCQTTSASTTVTVVPLPYITYSGTPSVCAGNTILLTVSTIGIPGVIYQWKRNGVNIPGAVAATYAANVSGDYTCFVNIPGSCSVLTSAVSITVFPTQFPDITFDGTYVKTYSTYATYQWYINTITIPGATNYRYAAYTNASYRVMVTDTNGCQLISNEFPIYNLAVENANAGHEVSIYPNPATNSVHIAADQAVNATITTLEGKVVLRGTSRKDLDVSGLANGLYMIILTDDKGNRLHMEKLVVSR